MRSHPLATLRTPDRACGAVAAAVAICLYLSACDLPYGTLSAPDSGFFPKTLSVLLLVLGLGMVLQPHSGVRTRGSFTPRSLAVPVAAAVLFAYAALVTKVGFVPSTIVVLFLLMTAYGGLRWTLALTASAAAVIICYLGFSALGVPLPQGLMSIF